MKTKFIQAGMNMLYDAMRSRTRINIPAHMTEIIDSLNMDGFDFSDMQGIADLADALHAEEYNDPNPKYRPYVGEKSTAESDLKNFSPMNLNRWVTDNKLYTKRAIQIRLDHNMLHMIEGNPREFEPHCQSITQVKPGAAVKVVFKIGDWAVIAYPYSEVISGNKTGSEHGILWGGKVKVTGLLTRAGAVKLAEKFASQKVKITDQAEIKKLVYAAHYG